MVQVPDDLFIDASTGRCYPVPSSPFLGVESLWNHGNYWVCMQMPEPHSDSRAPPHHLSLDFADSSKWESLLPAAAPQVTHTTSLERQIAVWGQSLHAVTATTSAHVDMQAERYLRLPHGLPCGQHKQAAHNINVHALILAICTA